MLYLLQVDVLVAIALLLPFFALYLAWAVLRFGYLAAIRFVHVVKARPPRLEAAFGDVVSDDREAKRPLEIVAAAGMRRLEPALVGEVVQPFRHNSSLDAPSCLDINFRHKRKT